MICRGFEPICAPGARVMVLGTMPSIRSLSETQYYAHPRNAFWPILFDTFGERRSTDYEVKKALIRDHDIALWDVAAACERSGSLDSAIRGVALNDFDALYRVCPGIQTVLCNGGTAYRLFLKSGAAGRRRVVRLPGTSPAYTLPYEKKLAAWREAIWQALLQP